MGNEARDLGALLYARIPDGTPEASWLTQAAGKEGIQLMYLQNCASPSANSFYFQMRECRISSSTSLLFLGFLGSENYVLYIYIYICLTSFHDFHVLFHSSPSFDTKVSFEIANFSQKIRGALVGIVSAGNQGEKSLKGRQKLGEKYVAKFLLRVETIWCCI